MNDTFKIAPDKIGTLVRRKTLKYKFIFMGEICLLLGLLLVLISRNIQFDTLGIGITFVLLTVFIILIFIFNSSIIFYYKTFYSGYSISIDEEKIKQKIQIDNSVPVTSYLHKATISNMFRKISRFNKKVMLKRITKFKQTKKGLVIDSVYRYERLVIPIQIERYDEIVEFLNKIKASR